MHLHLPRTIKNNCAMVLSVTFAATLFLSGTAQAAKAKIKISQAVWSAKTLQLTIKGSNNTAAQTAELYDINGRRLGNTAGKKFVFSVARDQLSAVPCAVRVEAEGDDAALPVKGAPIACKNPTLCQIKVPLQGASANVGEAVQFQAIASSKDKNALPFKYEWDFAGGAMDKSTDLTATAAFVRDDSSYRVRFAATDAKGRRCEDAVVVTVGTPPANLPAKVGEQAAAKFGEELDGTQGDVVVLPFEDWTFQNLSDMKYDRNGYGSFSPTANNLRAYAFKKDRLPVFLGNTGDDAVQLRYSAASNPSDPVGAGSINSTSSNYPVGAAFKDALLKKTDIWEMPTRPDAEKSPDYYACSWMMTGYYGAYGCNDALGFPTVDEGYFKAKKDDGGNVVANDPNTDNGHGAYMPGKSDPYRANAPQPFGQFVATEKARVENGVDQPASWFAANMLPLTDIDDQGRVNPYALLRVEAVDKQSNAVVAKADGVVSASRDFHCRECHAKGEVAANPNAPYTKAAFGSSAWGKFAQKAAMELNLPAYQATYAITEEQKPSKPEFLSVAELGGDPNSIADQEYAAAMNYSSLHQFYDIIPFYSEMRYGVSKTYLSDEEKAHPSGIAKDTPRPCYGCHATAQSFEPFKNAWWDEEGFKVDDPIYAPNYSITMHRWHGEMQWNAGKTDIVRDPATGAHVRWDWKSKGANNSTKTGSLFPIFDDNGKQLPMEENCLKCHSGHREPLFRDRMYTAGVTCFDCHGDMLAVGEAFPKNYLANKPKVGSTNRDDYRVAWFDQPDCASCHVGDGNQGADKSGGFFSAGVMKRAFDDADLSATPRAADRSDPNARRFSAAPLQTYQASIPTDFYAALDQTNGAFISENVDTKIDTALFREGKDSHGNVACAACHGAAHSVWPNRDPSANDNVTALQLQGHTGTILECNVCHTSDSFKNQEDLDGGVYSGDSVTGILGGPHNLHPVNDPNWWKQAAQDTPNSDGTTMGGWHNNYATKPDAKGKDQCAACHGDDHKGTRLSKTPVDRVFDFSGPEFKKLKKAGIKNAVVKVAAGSEIGCDTCHTLELSFQGVPGH